MEKTRFGILERIMNHILWVSVATSLVLFVGVLSIIHSEPTHAEAKASSISVGFTQDLLQLHISPTPEGTFGKSTNSTITVNTDNYTGYSMSIKSSDSTSIVNTNNDEITSISSAIDEATFSSSSSYNNKWGYKPSQYITSEGGIDTVTQNTNYLPAPSTAGDLLAKTSTANVSSDNYNLSVATRIDTTMPAGTYTYTYILEVVANPIVYNITYNSNTTGTVSNMPSPNPQPTTISGGTPAEESHATLSNMTPIRNDKKFAGWCDVATTTDSVTGDDVCSGNLLQPEDTLEIDQTAAPNITLYAVWVETLFPVVWNQMGACEFHGATNGNITGSACSDYHNVRFIDTGVALYSQANYLKDFEIHFTLDHYLPSEQVNYFGSEDNGQQTFVNDKLGSHAADGKAPGVTVRRATSNIDFNSKFGDEQEKVEIPYAQVHDVSMFRLDNKIYYSYDGGPLVFLQDITGFNQQFDLTTWFGAYPRDDCDGSQGPCTNAKRIPEATISNMYIRLGEYSDDDVHTINFKANDGTTTTVATYLIKDGNTLTTVPTAPIYADHYFQGWFTAQSGGTEVTASTVPSTSADYYARWLGSVAVADIDNPVISLEPNETEMIVVNNASELEPYSFSSSNDNVATVNSTTGEITAVGPGTATITMTGATSGATQTISVTVAGQVIHVSFDSQGGTPASYTWDVGNGSSFTTLPAPTKENYQLKGWWTGPNGTGTELTTSTVFDSNTPTQYYAKWEQLDYVCKIAKPNTLHVEQCGRTSDGCRAAGFANGADIEYGQLVSSATMTAGDAYDCDINNDGDWDDEDERFYYVGTTENNAAKFIYYRNISTDNPVYDTAITYLPTSSNPDWSNPNLVTFNTGDYNNTVTRFLTYPEALELCDNATTSLGTNGRCIYLLEKSAFAYTSGYNEGIWMEKQGEFKNRIQTKGRSLNHNKTTVNNEVRPVIEVPIGYIEPYSAPAQTYTITFDPHNETQSWTETIDQGDDLSDVYPATDPTYANHLFQGWFTAATGGSQISSSTEPSADTTYHAQWLKTVALAILDSNSITVEMGSTETITIMNVAELESYSFSSLNSSIATVDSATGVVTGVAEGSTTIRMTGDDSGEYIDIPVTVAPQALTTVCQLATAGTLHSATNADSVQVEYGYIANNPTPQPGDAYNCDVDNDGTYSAVNERFYYLGQDGDNNAVLVAWNNYQGNAWGPTDNTASTYTYANSIAQLPGNGTGEWDNPGLVEQSTGKAARHMYYNEVVSACGNINVTTANALEACNYLMEHTAYDNAGRSALWLMLEGSNYRRIHAGTGNRHVSSSNSTATSTVRPAIVVPYNLIEKYTPVLQDVTHAIIANNDLTVPAGGQITIEVSNSASLEPYTFSSDDSNIATVDSTTGVVTGVSVGTVDIIMTGTNSGLTKTLEVDVLSSLQDFTVTFNANGGTLDDGASSTRTVTDGDEVGTLPTASKTNHKFFGWYTDDGTFYDEVYADEVIEDDITFYAKWVEDTSSLPIVWSEINACQFNGNAVISGDHCTQNKTKKMVDTGVSLFNTANYQKDFEIGFTVVEYDTSSQSESQATLVNSKYENSGVNYPGFVLRRNNNNFQLTSKWSNGTPTDQFTTAASLKTVKIVRQNGVLKYSFNGGNLTTYFDTSGNTHRFDTRVWFGAAATSDNETPQRYLKGTLTDMYIRMGIQNTYNVELNPNGGTLPNGTQANYTITAGDPVGALPTPTAPSSSYTFGGWYDGNTLVSDGTQYIPTGDVTLVAKWVYNSSDTPVVFNIANDALQGYQTLINSWVPSPINITTFNEASPINDSTWGDTSELSEQEFWEGIKDNFEDNSCSIPSYSDAVKPLSALTNWVNGSYDCSKPKAYDTRIGAALNVYLDDKNGTQVAYVNAENGVIHNMIPGQTYYWEKADDSTVYGYVTATSVNGRRPIELSANRNTRDLGGLPVTYTDSNNQTVTGTLAYGRLFRGERLWSTPATELYNLGINKQYDVGDPTEYANDTKLSDYKWDPVVHYNFDYNSGDENNASSNYMKAWTAVTDIMTDITSANDPKNIYFHCRVGADRTGTTAYLLEGLLGVPDEARYEEYELTNLSGLYDRTRYYKQKTSTNNLKFVFMMEYVKTNADILNWYMSNPNSDMNLVQAFRSAMTVTNNGGGGNGSQSNSAGQSSMSMSMSPTSANGKSAVVNTENNYANSNNTDSGTATGNVNDNSSGDDNEASTTDGRDGYEAPLGVSTRDTEKNDTESNNTPQAVGLGFIAAAVIASGAAASYALTKQDSEE